MKRLLVNSLLFMVLISFSASVNAEYYIVYPEAPVPYYPVGCYQPVCKQVQRHTVKKKVYKPVKKYKKRYYTKKTHRPCKIDVYYYYPYAVYPDPCKYDCSACYPCTTKKDYPVFQSCDSCDDDFNWDTRTGDDVYP